MTAKSLNPAQLNVLMLMSNMKTEEELNEFKELVSDYYAKRVDEDMDKLIERGEINPDVIDGWLAEHMRTPYKR